MLSCYLVNCLHLIFFIYIKDLQMGLLTQAEPISDSNKEPNYKKKKKKKKKIGYLTTDCQTCFKSHKYGNISLKGQFTFCQHE